MNLCLIGIVFDFLFASLFRFSEILIRTNMKSSYFSCKEHCNINICSFENGKQQQQQFIFVNKVDDIIINCFAEIYVTNYKFLNCKFDERRWCEVNMRFHMRLHYSRYILYVLWTFITSALSATWIVYICLTPKLYFIFFAFQLWIRCFSLQEEGNIQNFMFHNYNTHISRLYLENHLQYEKKAHIFQCKEYWHINTKRICFQIMI